MKRGREFPWQRYEHLPIYKEAFDLALYFEKTVRGMARYDKYTLGAEDPRKPGVS